MTQVTVAVLTYRRVDFLRELLPLLLAHAAEVAAEGFDADVLVVDNDPAGSAADTVAQAGSPDRLRYVCEPTPGIAAARNRALDEAAGSDLLVFIDDDERPHPGWLRSLLATQATTSAAAVAGAVVSEFDGELDPWLSAGGFFQRRRLPTGTPIDVAATNNLLLDLRQLTARARFDPAFGLSGGEDTLFTRQLAARGLLLVWCDEAVVTDWVPRGRMTRSWVLRRAFSSGNSRATVQLALAAGARERVLARCLAIGWAAPRVAGGLVRWTLGRATGRAGWQARGLRTAARGAGMAAGAVGQVYLEYAEPVGDRTAA
jgi:glycosyltransferase involved in cell wall biosynthesis